MLDRVDEALMFSLPGVEQRKQILGVYLKKYIINAGMDNSSFSVKLRRRLFASASGRKAATDKIRVQGITDEVLMQAARDTDGFSGEFHC